MPSDYRAELSAATAAARQAGELIRSQAGHLRNVREKSLHDLVTQTDEDAQNLIIEQLHASFPDYDVLAEEGADLTGLTETPPRPRWIVDPLDGTTNFTHQVPPFCVSIALQDVSGELVVGVVYEVSMDELFAAARGAGATMNGEAIHVSQTGQLGDALVTTGFPFREFWYVDDYLAVLRRFMLETRGVRRPGSAAADLAWLACGRFDVFFEVGLAPWDVAAGIVLVQEAGGRIGGLTSGADVLFGGQILATNGRLHDAARAATRPLGEFYARGPKALYGGATTADTHSKATP